MNKIFKIKILLSIINTISKYIPKLQKTNTYILKRSTPITELFPIDKKFIIRRLTLDDEFRLIKFYGSPKKYEKVIKPRLEGNSWIGLVVEDSTNANLAYISWVISKNIEYISDFNICMTEKQFFMRHGYCSPEYRHLGLHTRMEQERINFCIKNGANEIFIQIACSNFKGIDSVVSNGFKFMQMNYILRIPAINLYRELYATLKNPFKTIN